MKTILHLSLLIGSLWCSCAAQNYKIISETRFAMRIHFNNPSNPQKQRVAGADHSVSRPTRDKMGLELTDDGGSVNIEGKQCPLSKEESHRLRLGMSIVVEEEYEVMLSSDAQDRSSALLVVRSATATDKALLELIELRLIIPPRNEEAEQDGADQPATAPESKPEGNEKPKPESEGRSQ